MPRLRRKIRALLVDDWKCERRDSYRGKTGRARLLQARQVLTHLRHWAGSADRSKPFAAPAQCRRWVDAVEKGLVILIER
jgi:hypothetical protein